MADQHAVRAPGSRAKTAAAPGVRARRGRLAAASPAVTGTAPCNEQKPQHQPSAAKPSQHRPKALPRRRKLKLPPPSAPEAPATASSALAGDASTDAPTAVLPAVPATASVVPAASVGSSLPRQPPPPPPPPPRQQQQLRTAAPSTPLLQDFLSGRGRLVKSVYRVAGLHELGLQQELSAAAPGAALLPPPPRPALPAPQQQQQLKIALVLMYFIAEFAEWLPCLAASHTHALLQPSACSGRLTTLRHAVIGAAAWTGIGACSRGRQHCSQQASRCRHRGPAGAAGAAGCGAGGGAQVRADGRSPDGLLLLLIEASLCSILWVNLFRVDTRHPCFWYG